MKNQPAKKRRGVDDDGSEIRIDRLSELPQPILHHILSLLPQKDAVQTCVLSKSWLYLWHGRSKVEFNEKILGKEIVPFFDKTLQRYLDQNLSIRQFIFDMQSKLDSLSAALLKTWIKIVIKNMGVRALSLKLGYYFSVPLVVFQAEFLVELNLQDCSLSNIKSTDNVMCKNLQKLCLHRVHVDDETFEKIMSSCPLIENLDIKCCKGLKTIKANNTRNLKHFDCSFSRLEQPTSIEIESPLCVLESIRLSECHDWFLRYNNNTFFPHLKSLNLHRIRLSDESFDTFSTNFPCLNELTLDLCFGFKHVLLMSRSIKRLTIETERDNKIKALIDTPNILYFQCSGSEYGFLPSIRFSTTLKEWESNISVGYKLKNSDNDATTWFLDLYKLLKGSSQSHRTTLSLRNQRYKIMHITDYGGGFGKPVAVETLRFLGFSSSSSAQDILNSFFRICRPRYIHMNRYSTARSKWGKENKQLAEFICKLIPAETRHCYNWLQDLEQVSIQVWDMKAQEWLCVQGKSFPALPKRKEEQQIRFRLKWRDQQTNFT